MSTEFLGETFEEQQSREKLANFYGQYSNDIRKNLLARNIARPDNIYDILYTKVRRDLLAKNEASTIKINLDETGTNVRNVMLAKHIETQINLDVTGENARQAQIAKNNLLQSTIDFNKVSNSIRNELLSKNVPIAIDLEKQSENSRASNLAHNIDKNINLEQSSDSVRSNLLAKNSNDSVKDLESSSASFRTNMLSSNVDSNINLEDIASQIRTTSLAKNNPINIDLDKQATAFRENQESQNIDKDINLETSANAIRNNMLSNNTDITQDINSIANTARQNNESKNIDNSTDITKLADSIRSNMLASNSEVSNPINDIANTARGNQESKNKDAAINLEDAASKVRSNMLSANDDKVVNLDDSATKVREGMLSANKTDNIDLDKIATPVRANMLAGNKEDNIDLEKSSEKVLANLLSANKPKDINLETSSEAPRNNLLANNVPINIDLDTSSVAPRNALLASNVPANIDLDTSSVAPRNSLLASNTPINIDLDASSVTPRNTLLATNVPANIDLDASAAVPRTTLLASNTPINIDLNASSVTPRNSLLSMNVPDSIDLETDAMVPRNNLLSYNVPKNIDLENDAAQIRNNLLAANITQDSQLDVIGDIVRPTLLSQNDSSGNIGATIFFGGTSTFVGVSALEIASAPIRQLMQLRGTILTPNTNLQAMYGLSISGTGYPQASITSAAQLYNLQKNAFMSVRYSDKNSGYNLLLNHNTDGFQNLLSFSQISSIRETQTNSTPASVITQNKGTYIGLPTDADSTSPVTRLLKPTDGVLGTATSMMANTVPSDVISVNFNKDDRGVAHIINTIKKDTTIPISKNYDVQNTSSFIIGTNADGSNKLAYSRYTTANPYQPNTDAGTLELRIKNYAIANGGASLLNTMSFPPYVKAFANSDSANWNKIDFVGRPEAIYTYSNSSREGSLSFYVLTDFSQQVDIGYDFANSQVLTQSFNEGIFSSSDNTQQTVSDIDTTIFTKQSQIATLQSSLTLAQTNNVSDTASIKQNIRQLKTDVTKLESQKLLLQNKKGQANRDYSEFDKLNGNIYKTLVSNGGLKDSKGNISLQTEDTVTRLARMKKDSLFQPAFFSGDKVDFVNRMEFLSKLTRPSRNNSGKGFSFVYPPVCHIHLGDWFNHDVIINNVSYDYSDAPWTIDGSGGRVQPMWALVNISFNIIGSYEAQPGVDVPLATDIGGFYQKKAR